MKVYELLNLTHLEGLHLVAGKNGKDREVQSVNMMDAPDIIPFLNKNELLITTAYHLKDQPHMLIELVQAMSKQGCAALGIKTKRFLNEIPKDVIKLANELSFPIIELPFKLSLGQIVNQIFQAMKEKALKHHAQKRRNDFFNHFLNGTFSSQEEIIGRASEFSLKNEQKYICVVGKIDEEDRHSSYVDHQEKTDDIYDFIDEEISLERPKIHFFKVKDSCILLFELKDDDLHQCSSIKSTLQHLQKLLFNYHKCSISFGISNICRYFIHTKKAVKEAEEALSQGRLSKKKGYIQTYHTKDILELMRQIPREELNNYYSFALGGLSNTKINEDPSLLETLSVYLETHCQISETAKRLFVHRNTVVYRIEKCEEILGKSLKDSETTLQIRLALRIKLLLEE